MPEIINSTVNDALTRTSSEHELNFLNRSNTIHTSCSNYYKKHSLVGYLQK